MWRDPQEWILPGLSFAGVIAWLVWDGVNFFDAVNGLVIGVFWCGVVFALIAGVVRLLSGRSTARR